MSAQITASEMLESLTGFDEIAIAHHYGAEALELAEKKPTMLARALAFVHMTREGLTVHEAKQQSMELSIRNRKVSADHRSLFLIFSNSRW